MLLKKLRLKFLLKIFPRLTTKVKIETQQIRYKKQKTNNKKQKTKTKNKTNELVKIFSVLSSTCVLKYFF